jgi:hypothetical protein
MTTPPQPTFVATSPILTFATSGTVTTTVQVLNPGRRSAVRFELVLLPTLPKCTTVSSNSPVNLVANDVTTLLLSYKGSFDTSLTGATVLMVPANDAIGSRVGCVAKTTLSAKGGAPSPKFKPKAHSSKSRARSAKPQAPAAKGSSPSSTVAQPEAIVLTLRRDTTIRHDLWMPLIYGLVFAVIGVLAIWMLGRDGTRWRAQITAASSWNFKDSLATNATAVGGLLAAVIAAAGATSTEFPGIDTSHFGLLNALWAGVATLAPLLLGFAAPRRVSRTKAAKASATPATFTLAVAVPIELIPDGEEPPPATPIPVALAPAKALPATLAPRPAPGTSIPFFGLLAATAITLLAVGGELGTLGVYVSLSAASTSLRDGIYVLLVVVALLVAYYVFSTTATLVETQGEKGPARSSLNAFPDTSLAA